MYIVAIAWLYVTLMMAITEKNLVAGAMTFLFYGVLPLALVLWLVGVPRRRMRKAAEATGGDGAPAGKPAHEADPAPGSVPHEHVQKPDRPDAKPDQ